MRNWVLLLLDELGSPSFTGLGHCHMAKAVSVAHLVMSILKAVMVDFRAWNNCLVALNMYIKWVRDRDSLCGDIAVQCFILIAESELLKRQLNDLRRDQNIKDLLIGSCKLTNRYGAVEFRSGFWMDAPRRCSWNIPPIHERQASAFDTASTARGLNPS